MNTLDKLTIYDIGRADRIYIDGELIDDLDLLEMAIRSPDELKSWQFSVKTMMGGEVIIEIW